MTWTLARALVSIMDEMKSRQERSSAGGADITSGAADRYEHFFPRL